MKRIVLVVIALLFISNNLKSQTGWTVYNTGINAELRDIRFINANTGFIASDTNCIFKSTNGGLNWYSVPLNLTSPAQLLTISFLNQSTGYAGGGHHTDEYNYARYLFKTTDGGNSWVKLYHDSSYSMIGAIANIIPFNENDILISNVAYIEVFMMGGIYKSTNGGINFSTKFGGFCNSLSFVNQNTGYVVTKTTSDYQPSVTKILKTTDGCATWMVQHRDSANGIGSYFSKIQAFDVNTAYALNSSWSSGNYYIRFFKTLNGGNSWEFTPQTNSREDDMFFINPSTGWIGGYMGADSSLISYTTNSGANWTLQKKNFESRVRKIFFLNESTGWVALYDWGMPSPPNKRIMKTTTSGITHIKNVNNVTPSSYSLGQNYPNPFNPVTNVKFSIINSGNVKLIMYDVMGREVQTLVNEKLQPGTYETSFDGSKLNSGVYFYKLSVGDFLETKRMLLIK
jgi:photosystem II stability/assembly factor-like uncharacterized protein